MTSCLLTLVTFLFAIFLSSTQLLPFGITINSVLYLECLAESPNRIDFALWRLMESHLSSTMQLRKYSPADFQRLWELDQKCFSSEIAYSRRELAHYLRSKMAICVVGWQKQQIVGFVVGHHDPRGFGHVVTLDVDPSARKAGIGSNLMRAIEQRFQDANCKSILLEVAVNNRPALGFYKKHGYSVLKTLPRYYPGEVDGLLMGKRISAGIQSR